MRKTVYLRSVAMLACMTLSAVILPGCGDDKGKPEVTLTTESTTEITTETTQMTAPDIKTVREFQDLIDRNESGEIPIDLKEKTITTINGGRCENQEYYEYDGGRVISHRNTYNGYDNLIEYEYSGDRLVRKHSVYKYPSSEPDTKEFNTDLIYEGDLLMKEITYINGYENEVSEYEYEDGNLIKNSLRNEHNDYLYTYEYRDGELVRKAFNNVKDGFDWILDFYYDGNGNLIKTFQDSGSKEQRTHRNKSFEYDDSGMMIKSHCDFEGGFSADEEYEDKTYEYELNDGLVVTAHSVGYDNYGKATGGMYTLVTRYDEYGNKVIYTKTQDGQSEPDAVTKWDNTYDDQGRLIKVTQSNSLNDLVKITEYTYR